jgi:membrane protein implicated in regulation of membrane protease activity
MRRGGWTLFWIAVIVLLVVGELAEITHVFTVPLAAAFLSPYAILFALTLITLLSLVGAVFVGFYLSSRIYASRGFTPFEQEMLRMREEVRRLGESLERLEELRSEERAGGDPPPATPGGKPR